MNRREVGEPKTQLNETFSLVPVYTPDTVCMALNFGRLQAIQSRSGKVEP
jgi:hypothetical protein